MPGELDLVLERSQALGVPPNIGIRIKLSAKAGGHWTESGGDRSIFGLNMSEVISIVDTLKERGMLGSLKLLHYHLGSQIPNIRDIRSAVLEATRVYAELVKEGAPMGTRKYGPSRFTVSPPVMVRWITTVQTPIIPTAEIILLKSIAPILSKPLCPYLIPVMFRTRLL